MNSRMRPRSAHGFSRLCTKYITNSSLIPCGVIAHTVYPSLASPNSQSGGPPRKPHPRTLSQAAAFPKGSARMHFASAKDSLLPSPPPPPLSFLLNLFLLSSRREFIGTTRDDVKLPFHARKRISHIISAPRAAFSTLFSDLRRHVDLIVAIIYERQFGTRPPQRPKSRRSLCQPTLGFIISLREETSLRRTP